MLEALEYYFPSEEGWTEGIKWNEPEGGFFLTMDIPFKITDKLLTECVKDYGVIFCPMSFFYIGSEINSRQVRLAFSNIQESMIDEGLLRIAKFIKEKVKKE